MDLAEPEPNYVKTTPPGLVVGYCSFCNVIYWSKPVEGHERRDLKQRVLALFPDVPVFLGKGFVYADELIPPYTRPRLPSSGLPTVEMVVESDQPLRTGQSIGIDPSTGKAKRVDQGGIGRVVRFGDAGQIRVALYANYPGLRAEPSQ